MLFKRTIIINIVHIMVHEGVFIFVWKNLSADFFNKPIKEKHLSSTLRLLYIDYNL